MAERLGPCGPRRRVFMLMLLVEEGTEAFLLFVLYG
jgi:hypothetical protein